MMILTIYPASLIGLAHYQYPHLQKLDEVNMSDTNPVPSMSMSPRPAPTTDFYKALRALAESGKCITRVEWANTLIYGKLVDGKVTIRLEDNMFHPWIINDGDLAATDWVILSSEPTMKTVRAD